MERTWTLRMALAGCCGAFLLAFSGGARDVMASGGEPSRHERKQSVTTHASRSASFVIPTMFTTDPATEESEPDPDEISSDAADSIARVGLRNAGRLLPLAKKLTIEALHRTATSVGLKGFDLSSAEAQILAIDSVVLDESLYDWAEVDVEQPSVIRVGMLYAFYLNSSEEAIFLLGHELTHVAAWSDDISPLVDSIRTWAGRTSDVWPSVDQKEDLMCDFIGEQVLKLYIFNYPSPKPVDIRMARGLMYEGEPIGGDSGDGDAEHLDYNATMRAWVGLDPDLHGMLALRE